MGDGADKESKTEEPSERKILHAREQGDEPVSQEVQILFSLTAMTALAAASTAATGRLANVLSDTLESADKWPLATNADFLSLLLFIGREVAGFLAPFLLAIAIAGIAAAAIQNPIAFRPQRIAPNLDRLSPARGMGRLFGTQSLIILAKTTAKLVLITTVVALLIRRSLGRLFEAMMTDVHLLPDQLRSYLIGLLIPVIMASAAIAASDYAWTRFKWRSSLRMTRQEIKDEMKQADGDPAVKARVAAVSKERSRKRMMAAVPKATLVVVNPTHYAVAMRYKRSEGGAPIVVARGLDEIALEIRTLAERHNIDVVEDAPLARALYDNTRLDQAIPVEFYGAIARLLTVLYRNHQHKKN